MFPLDVLTLIVCGALLVVWAVVRFVPLETLVAINAAATNLLVMALYMSMQDLGRLALVALTSSALGQPYGLLKWLCLQSRRLVFACTGRCRPRPPPLW